MKYRLTNHAQKRLKERSIPLELLEAALQKPTKLLYNRSQNRVLFKKLYWKGNKQRLLMAVADVQPKLLLIITVIDTSKVKKYL